MSVEVVVPLRTNGCPYRQKAWEFCRNWWDRYTYSLVIAPGGEPWSKGEAVMPAIAASKAEIVVVCDADVLPNGLEEAVRAVRNGSAWARPHSSVVRLSREGTGAYMAGEPWNSHPLDRKPYPGLDGGGVVVAPRKTLLEIPMDPRFTGWGNEDWAWGFALTTFLRKPWRGIHPLIHLWHPSEPRDVNRKDGSPENQALWQRYHDARSNPDRMRQLLEEARESFRNDEPSLHHCQPQPVGRD